MADHLRTETFDFEDFGDFLEQMIQFDRVCQVDTGCGILLHGRVLDSDTNEITESTMYIDRLGVFRALYNLTEREKAYTIIEDINERFPDDKFYEGFPAVATMLYVFNHYFSTYEGDDKEELLRSAYR